MKKDCRLREGGGEGVLVEKCDGHMVEGIDGLVGIIKYCLEVSWGTCWEMTSKVQRRSAAATMECTTHKIVCS